MSKFVDKIGKGLLRSNTALLRPQNAGGPKLLIPQQTARALVTDKTNGFNLNKKIQETTVTSNSSSTVNPVPTVNPVNPRSSLLLPKVNAETTATFQLKSFNTLSVNQASSLDDPYGEDPTPLEVNYWVEGRPSVPFEQFQIDCKAAGFDMKKILTQRDEHGKLQPDMDLKMTQDLRDNMAHKFNEVGMVHLVNCGLENTAEVEAAVRILHPERMVYEGGANLRAPLTLETNVYDTGAPSDADLHYHHEMAYVNASTRWLAFGALTATKNPLKGATFIAHNNMATDMLMNDPKYRDFGRKLVDKGVCYIRKLPDKKYFDDNPQLDKGLVYNYWQTSTLCEDQDEAQRVMESKGLEVEWEDSKLFGRYMVTKFYVDTFEYDPFTDKNTLYASVADDYAWFDSWPGVKNLPHYERPLKLTFGDGEVMTRADKQRWVDVYDKSGTPVLWKKGDLAIICNFRTAHGRPQYHLDADEKRDLGVVLGEPFVRQGAVEGKD